ncbi:MAG TPA: hypothetical protein PKA90_03125 [Ignavibacteria bacterium]|nr:hypothetical protein [Ignavibacteria bacterium]
MPLSALIVALGSFKVTPFSQTAFLSSPKYVACDVRSVRVS